jgi:predicted amidohydrolase YtcJ
MRRAAFTTAAAVAALVPAAMLVPAAARAQAADLVVLGRVWTGDPARPWAEAVAVRDSVIVLVGSRAEARRLTGARTRVLENGANLVTPGFGDAHTHFLSGGFQLASVDLRDADTPEEFIRRIAAFARTVPAGRWITGGDWDHERWRGSPLPRREWIDSVTPHHPVFVNRLDGHMGVANSLALRLAGIDRSTPVPPGGDIVRDAATGDVTGVLKDNAMDRLWAAVPAPSAEEADTALQRAMRHAASLGVTFVHTMTDWSEFAALRRAHARGAMITRARVYVPIGGWRRLADTVRAAGRGDDWLSWGGLKGYMDGSLGSTTAAFFEPYLDAPGSRGLMVTDSAQREREVVAGDSAGLQLAVHAIGDRAIAMLLSFFEQAAQRNGARDRRFRVEHAQHIRQSDIARFGRLGVIPSMQPYHAIDDGRWAGNRLDTARLRGTYAFRSLLDTGARLAFGSDWTVATLDPLWGLYAAVTRRTLDDRHPDGWFAEQRITVDETLRAYTSAAAFAGFQERRLGMLRPGLLADVVVLDFDPFRTPPAELARGRVRVTVVGGRVVFERPSGRAAR